MTNDDIFWLRETVRTALLRGFWSLPHYIEGIGMCSVFSCNGLVLDPSGRPIVTVLP